MQGIVRPGAGRPHRVPRHHDEGRESFEQALDVALGGDLGAGRLGRWVRLEEPVEEAFTSVTQTLRAVCAGELSLDDVTSAGAGRLFAEGDP